MDADMRKKKQTGERVIVGYDYSTREMREETADALFRRAKSAGAWKAGQLKVKTGGAWK